MKITQKNLTELPEGVHRIETNFYVRVRGSQKSSFFFRKDGRRKEVALGGTQCTPGALARARTAKLRTVFLSGNDLSLK